MSTIFDLSESFGFSSGDTDSSLVPFWVVAVIPLDNPLSFSRQNMMSKSLMPEDGVRMRADAEGHRQILVISSDDGCEQCSVSNNKSSHIESMSAVFLPGDIDYRAAILPGDWVFAWMLQSEEQGRKLIERIRKLQRCNEFMDGLKFMGRAQAPRRHRYQDAGTGMRRVRYTLSAAGFNELDTSIFYDPDLAEIDGAQGRSLGVWLAKLSLNIKQVFLQHADGNVDDNIHMLIPTFLDLLVGRGGISKSPLVSPTGRDDLRALTGGGSGLEGSDGEAPFAYTAPIEAGKLLGRADPSKTGGTLAYADLLDLIVGLQKYGTQNSKIEGAMKGKAYAPLIPYLEVLSSIQHKYTGTPLMGAFLPIVPAFDGRPLWSVLQQFLNPVVNEMYTCLRVNEEGLVVPTLIVRQIPFSTEVFRRIQENELAGDRVQLTPFLSLPRWKIPDVFVLDDDTGRSDATRINFVHVYGIDRNTTAATGMTEQLTNNPPIRDDLDIERSGLRPFMTTSACTNKNTIGTVPRKWMKVIADFTIGSQLTLNGSLTCFGIQAPICKGDNFEFENTVYHIEGVTHTAGIDPETGKRTFRTTLSVSNGMRSETDRDFPPIEDGSYNHDEYPIYPGVMPHDSLHMPGLTVEKVS